MDYVFVQEKYGKMLKATILVLVNQLYAFRDTGWV